MVAPASSVRVAESLRWVMGRGHLGPVLIFSARLSYLLAPYFVWNALIIKERKKTETLHRHAVLRTHVVEGVLSIFWVLWSQRSGWSQRSEIESTGACRQSTKRFSCSACFVFACVALVLQATQTWFLFFCGEESSESSYDGLIFHTVVIPNFCPLWYGEALATFLQGGILLLQIPLAQTSTAITLARRENPARFKMLGWLVAAALGLLTLVFPDATDWVVWPCMLCPFLLQAGILYLHRHVALGTEWMDSKDSEVEKAEEASASSPAARSRTPNRISGRNTCAFLLLGVFSGTLGEALTDMATNLSIRRSLQRGGRELAIANQCLGLLSTGLAFYSESRAVSFETESSAKRRRGLLCMVAWAACQGFRVLSLGILDSGETGTLHSGGGDRERSFWPCVALSGMVFFDKLTGPLGGAALDGALLLLLSEGSTTESRVAVSAELLWTLRLTVSRMERPLSQLVLLEVGTGRGSVISSFVFTCVTTVGVLAVLSRQEKEKAE